MFNSLGREICLHVVVHQAEEFACTFPFRRLPKRPKVLLSSSGVKLGSATQSGATQSDRHQPIHVQSFVRTTVTAISIIRVCETVFGQGLGDSGRA